MFHKEAATEGVLYNFTKKESLAEVLSHEFCEIVKNTFLTEYLWVITSIHKEVLLKNLIKVNGKRLSQSLFLIKL